MILLRDERLSRDVLTSPWRRHHVGWNPEWGISTTVAIASRAVF